MQDGNDKGFALYDEVNGTVRDDLSQDGGIGDIFSDLEGAAVELLGDSKDFDKKEDESDDLSELDVPSGVLDKSNDSVRVYLREMGMVPLLTREGEIELAKRIERGENAVRKALSRSRLVIQFLLDTKRVLEQGKVPVFESLQAPDQQPGQNEDEDPSQALREQLLETLQTIDKLYKKSQQTEHKLVSVSRNMKPKQYRKLRFEYARQIVYISRSVRALPFSARYRRSLSSGLRQVISQVRPLEQEIARLQRKLEQMPAASSSAASVTRKELKTLTAQLQTLEEKCGVLQRN